MPSQKVELIDTSQIDFDPENPRFYRLGSGKK